MTGRFAAIILIALISSPFLLSAGERNELDKLPGAMHSLDELPGAEMGHSMEPDGRAVVKQSPMMKNKRLENMREHLRAVQEIVSLISRENFNKAADIASKKLGLSPKTVKMCNMMEDKAFADMAIAFHKSGDRLSKALKTGDMKKSMKALDETLGFCVTCHDFFRF